MSAKYHKLYFQKSPISAEPIQNKVLPQDDSYGLCASDVLTTKSKNIKIQIAINDFLILFNPLII